MSIRLTLGLLVEGWYGLSGNGPPFSIFRL